MPTESRFTRTWAVGRFTVTLSCDRTNAPGEILVANCEWDPRLPDDLTLDERLQYIVGYCRAVDDMKRETDVLLHVDLGGAPSQHH